MGIAGLGARAAGRALPAAGWARAGAAGLLAGTAAWTAWLLIRFPYAGLYGQDAYAYYYEALAFWDRLTGQAAPPGQPYSTASLGHWPIGYHLHLLLGFLLAGADSPAGGRAITLLLAVGCPLLVYALAGLLRPDLAARPRVVAGLVAGGALLLSGTFARMGLSLMSDVPALFWSLLALVGVLHAWPPPGAPAARRQVAWAAGAGLALGLAILVRYGAGLIVLPLGGYLLLRALPLRVTAASGRPAVALALGVVVALLPQAAYLLTQGADAGYATWLGAWQPGNVLATTVSSVDGTSTFAQPMIVFYGLLPVWDGTDFLAPFYLPAIVLGAAGLVRRRAGPVLGLLAAWWLGPALFYAGTPYQAHRFVLAYLPVAALLAGWGAATALEAVLATRAARSPAQRGAALLAVLVLAGIAAGAWQGQRGARDWVATHAGWQAGEQAVVAAAQQAAGPTSPAAPPHALAFGITAALYHYTHWPIADLYDADPAAIARFWAAPGPRLLVLPLGDLAQQWGGTPLAARWAWLQAHYTLQPAGQADGYTVYRVGDAAP